MRVKNPLKTTYFDQRLLAAWSKLSSYKSDAEFTSNRERFPFFEQAR